MLIDSANIKVLGEGEWKTEKLGAERCLYAQGAIALIYKCWKFGILK
ncbi:hypothetical protein JFK97_15870 [Chromobacterium phragmitis]|nr:hypothetical protein [Chromobacterium amazonense]MBM2885875.1 hypothetical protein [Chromobacterium amazonense]MDE1715529.1 hypothetical protein [Chromobacterium amazonense]